MNEEPLQKQEDCWWKLTSSIGKPDADEAWNEIMKRAEGRPEQLVRHVEGFYESGPIKRKPSGKSKG